MTVHIHTQDAFSALFTTTPKAEPEPTTFGELLHRQSRDLQYIKAAVDLMWAYGVDIQMLWEHSGSIRLANKTEGVSFWVRAPDWTAIQDFFERVCQTEGVAL